MTTPRQIFDDFRARMLSKTDDWQNLIADNIRLTGPLAAVEGKEAFIAINTPFFASIQGSELHQVIEKDDFVLTQISVDVATPTGKVITLEVSEWYEIRNGKIQSLRVYFDTAELRNEM